MKKIENNFEAFNKRIASNTHNIKKLEAKQIKMKIMFSDLQTRA